MMDYQYIPKYFQYLSLLFSEIYLEAYFRDKENLLRDLNEYLLSFNLGDTRQQEIFGSLYDDGLPKDDRLEPYTLEDLTKIAFWSATGSGKTLLMHINIKQYQYYLERHSSPSELNRIILLTPNEGLSRQHEDEFRLSGIDAELFDKAGKFWSSNYVQIIDINKLKETSGVKTTAVDSFEGNNLVLVDEGHRGTSGKDVGLWMEMRNRLCEKGFSFEYSATFGQAMRATTNKNLPSDYAKCILFDYSYKFFHQDGYGKEYRILNLGGDLKDNPTEDHRSRYLTACLLAFFQQQKLFEDKKHEIRPYLIENPLWIFVGGSVIAPKKSKLSQHDQTTVSDVVDILLFLAKFVRNKEDSIRILSDLLKGSSGLQDAQGRELFSGAYTYLGTLKYNGESIFSEILKLLFNASSPGALHVKRLKGDNEGELELKIGNAGDAFGVVNVGDSSGLCKLCDKHEVLAVSDSEFSASIFKSIQKPDSKINILIGSKKFSEGWSSWRVSTMGLMNIGKKEGSQIIQLFWSRGEVKGARLLLKEEQRTRRFKSSQGDRTLRDSKCFRCES